MTLSPANVLAGAQGRLMPPALIFSFFSAAALYHLGMWVLIAFNAETIPFFQGGPGPLLGAVHLLTLGVLVMTAIGASMQFLSVVTKHPFTPIGLCHMVAVLFIPGVGILAYGMAEPSIGLMETGGSLVALALLGFAVLLAGNLWKARGVGVTLGHCWVAAAALVIFSAMGLLLAANYEFALFSRVSGVAMAHFIVAAFGFMGILAFGFSHILVPMFTLAPAPRPLFAHLGLSIAIAAIGMAATGAIVDHAWLMALGAVLGLIATGLHLNAMQSVLAGRMRKRLGISFLLVKGGWTLLPFTLLVGLLTALGYGNLSGGTLFAFLALFGWLLSFLLGILQRIIPFLATMHAGTKGGRRPTISEIGNDRALGVHAVSHGAAVAIMGAGIVSEQQALLTIGTLLGCLGAVAFTWFTAGAIFKTFFSSKAPSVTADKSP